VVLVPPPTMPAWATNGNITIAKTAMLNTIPILLIDISAPLLMLSGTIKILKCCCYVQVRDLTFEFMKDFFLDISMVMEKFPMMFLSALNDLSSSYSSKSKHERKIDKLFI